MSLSTYSTTDSISKWLQGWPLVRLSKRAADRASLCMAPTSSYSVGGSMSQQGLALLAQRNERLALATTADERQAIYTDIRQKAERIDYAAERPGHQPEETP